MRWRDLKEGDVTISDDAWPEVYITGPEGGLAVTEIGKFPSIKDAKRAILERFKWQAELPRVFKVKGERAYPMQVLPARVRNIVTH